MTLRKIIFMSLLSIISNNSIAAWVQIGNTVNFSSFVDPATIHREGIKAMEGSKAKMLTLIDYTAVLTKNGKAYSSLKAQHEFDCRQQQVRMLSSSLYAGHMGTGVEIESNYRPENWRPIPMRSIEETLWKVACNK